MTVPISPIHTKKGARYCNRKMVAVVTPRICVRVKRLVLPVWHLSSQKMSFLAIYRVEQLLNPTTTLKCKKKLTRMYLIATKAVCISSSFLIQYDIFHTVKNSKYDRGQANAVSEHVFIREYT